MHVFEVFELARKRPAVFTGGKSLKGLHIFFGGYDGGSYGTEKQLKGHEELRTFNDWVAKQLGFSHSTGGWCNMILERAGSDEKAFDLFFELLDKYRKEPSA